MKLINKSKGSIIAEDVFIADKLFPRIKGLLGRTGLGRNSALVLKPCNSIHTFFMKFAIDVLFVDKNNKIIRMISDCRPFRLSPIVFKSSYVIELTSGLLKDIPINIGDIVSIE